MRKLLTAISISCIFIYCFGCTKAKNSIDNYTKECNTEQKYYNFYTGLECSKEENNNSAFMVIVENSERARPQSGLSYADILYETSAEGGIPRFLALFSSSYPSSIGPVRSVRPYFLDIIKEFNLPFAHCGGSLEALNTISNDSSLISINEIDKGSYFWRDSSKAAPHNLYTSSDNIKKYIADNSINIIKSKEYSYDENYFNSNDLNSANKINLIVNKSYNTSYEYKDNLYYKTMNSKPAIDSLNNSQLCFSNIIIQKTPISLCSDNSHLNIPLIGDGDGFVFSKGKMIEAKWSRSSKDSKTKLTDIKGNEIFLSPGKTMWNIVDIKSKIEILH
ncbi:MAG: DUF3048 domain-containing protein [Clostridium sp.]|uniref:DUF3048 domain-containing protein n=1 Tax=Clostridium sp. DSM 8431 TaxID=1761781 RepID=UPI0008E07DDF|nr:DUF3048 domain-containing protein [Clostridium sp. DSM 8431]MCR4943251.1 DUF3048 domain-containing protein [Clostridium sp.]SFU40657.1 Protein of unknown function [Clostridium sp. DSM 8431]